MKIVNGVDVTDFEFERISSFPHLVEVYKKTFVTPFTLSDVEKCYNVDADDRYYKQPIVKKAIPLYTTYVKKAKTKGTLLGEGKLIGYLAYMTGKTLCGGVGFCGFRNERRPVIGLVLNKDTKMAAELSPKNKSFRIDGLTTEYYTLVSRIRRTVGEDRDYSYLEIALQGDDGFYIELTANYADYMITNFD